MGIYGVSHNIIYNIHNISSLYIIYNYLYSSIDLKITCLNPLEMKVYYNLKFTDELFIDIKMYLICKKINSKGLIVLN